MVSHDELRAQAAALRRQGFSYSQIGRRLAVHKSIIARWVADVPFDGFNPESRAEQLRSVRDPRLYNRALELRKAGWSYKMIEAEIGVAHSTLSGWLRNVSFSEYHPAVRQRTLVAQRKAVEANRIRQHASKAKIAADVSEEVRLLLADGLSDRELFLIGLTLYWAEGGKTQPLVTVANSDPYVVRLFVLWLQRCLSIRSEQLRAGLYTHPGVDIDQAENYWSAVIGIPRSQFYKAQIDNRPNKTVEKRGKLPHGTVHVTALGQGSHDLHRRIMGWITGFGEHLEDVTRE